MFWVKNKNRGRLARRHFSPGAHPAAETPFYIAAASVSARGDAQCVWSHESSISSSYERKHGSARSHIFTSVKTRRVKLVGSKRITSKREKQLIAKLTRRPQFLQSTLAQLSSVQDASAQLGSVKVGSTQATFREWLSATGSVQAGSARVCSAQCALRELRRAMSHESGLRKLHCSRLLRASCSLHASPLCKLLCASALSKLLCASALRQLLRASALRMCSVQVRLCKLLCASALCTCSVQVALRKLLCASDSAQVALRKCCRSCGNVLRVLFSYVKVAIFQLELRECAPRATFVLKSCDFPAGAGSTLRVLRLYLKVAIFQPELQEHAPRTTFVLKSCNFQAGAAADQGGMEPATAGLRKQARKPRDNFQRPSREQQNRTAPQRERFDTHDLRRGFAETKKNSHGATARALRHARSPQRVRPGMPKTQKKRDFLHLDHADPRRGSRGHRKKRKKNLKFLHLDHADLRRGSRGHIKKLKASSFCTSTTPIPAEGRIPDRRQHPHPPPTLSFPRVKYLT